MKLQQILEGTWAAPQTAREARELTQIMQTPIPANQASDQIYHLMGDDELFDQIAEVEQENGEEDIRPLIANRLKEWINKAERQKGFSDWKNPWDPEALNILEDIVRKYY